MEIDEEVLEDFIAESHENLDLLDRALVDLEQDPEDEEIISEIFRALHTIKGTCAFLCFEKMLAVTHSAETLLSRLRDKELTASPAVTTALLACCDATRDMLTSIEDDGNDGENVYADLIVKLDGFKG